jgi:hypothetical protein
VCEDRVSSMHYSAKPSVSFTLDAITTVGNTVLNVGLIRSSGAQYAAKVTFSTSDMTATAGKDYFVAQDRTVVIPGGRTSGSVEVSILRGHGTFQIAISKVEVECAVGTGVFNCPGDVGFPSFVIASINNGHPCPSGAWDAFSKNPDPALCACPAGKYELDSGIDCGQCLAGKYRGALDGRRCQRFSRVSNIACLSNKVAIY